MNRLRRALTTPAVLALAAPAAAQVAAPSTAPATRVPAPIAAPATRVLTFAVTYDGAVTGSYSGRVYVMLSTRERGEPRDGPSWIRTDPFFAVDVEGWKPGAPLILDDDALGYPAPLSALEAGSYRIQAVMRRNLDSPTIGRGPGTTYSAEVRRSLDGATGGRVELHVDRIVEPRPFPERDDIRLLEVRSTLMSAFYGRDITMRAAVILPAGYHDDDAVTYPALYFIGGFGSDHRFAPFVKRLFAAMPGADRVCLIVPDPLCRTGHHAFADSDNNGPWGRALVEELIPALEKRFRLVAAPRGRFLTGVSSGGWSSLWLQVSHPDFFGGTWSLAPDPVDFRAFQLVDLYAPRANMYTDGEGRRRPLMRSGEQEMMWCEPFARLEQVMGEGGQLGSFEAVFSPRGPDGRPAALFDRDTGVVDAAVAEAWKRYDIRLILAENWPRLRPQLAGKINVFCGEWDNFYLQGAVELLKQWQESAGAEAVIEILPDRNHMDILNRELQERILRELLEQFDRG